MTPERHRKIAELFGETCKLSPSAREAFIQDRCADDAALGEEVRSLLEFWEPTDQGLSQEGLREGDVFAERYRIVSRIGKGGMGVVYRAEDIVLSEQVALKLLISPDPNLFRLMLNEVRLSRQVTHPCVCRVYDIGEFDGARYLTMQLIEGEDLGSLLRREGPLSPERVLKIARQMAEGLSAAHTTGVLHRDLKPANVMIAQDGSAIITDFGIATRTNGAPTMVAGTPGYMPPEQFEGGAITEQVDIFAFGVVLYELLTGKRPYREPGSMRTGLLVPPSHIGVKVHPTLETVTLAALSTDPEDRPRSFGDILDALKLPEGRHQSQSTRMAGVAERRHLTLVSCMVVPPDGLDPEEHHALVSGACQSLGQCFEDQGGFVPQRDGATVAAYFGYPIAREDDTQRAIRTALSLSKVMSKASSGVGLRVAIHSGAVVVQPESGVAFGDAVTSVEQLTLKVPLGSIVMSDETQRLVHGLFVRTPSGIETELPTWTVLEEIDPDGSESATIQGPFVGREHEIEFLRERWARAKDGAGQVVSMAGDPGVGKSRLLSVFQEALMPEQAQWLTCQCSLDTRGVAFSPLIELLKTELGIRPSSSPRDRLERLAEWCAGKVHGGKLVQSLGPLIGASPYGLSLAPTPEVARREAIAGLVLWLLALGESGPAVVIIEDLHWCDPSSLECLSLIVDEVPSAALLVLTTFRTGYEPPWSPMGHAVPLFLDRLGDRECRELIEKLAVRDDLSETWVRALIERSDGVPLFLEEILRSLGDEERPTAVSGASTTPTPAGEIPATLEGSLMARLDRLGSAKDVAQLASIIGREFTESLLTQVADQSKALVQEGLEQLIKAKLIVRRGLGESAYCSFRHALIREKAYHSCLKSRRLEIHGRIARLLEREPASSRPEILAWHLESAGRPREAAAYWARAGSAALDVSAHLEAIENYRRGLSQIQLCDKSETRDERELALLAPLIVALIAVRGYSDPEVEEVLTRSRQLCDQLRASVKFFPVLVGLFWLQHDKGDRESVRPLQAKVASLARKGDNPALLAIASYTGGFCAHAYRESLKATELFNECIRLCDDLPSDALAIELGEDPCSISLAYLSYLAWFDGSSKNSWRLAKEACVRARKLDHAYSLALCLTFTSVVAWLRKDHEEAKSLADEAIDIARAHAFQRIEAVSLVIQGAFMARGGEVEEGLVHIRKGNNYFLEHGAIGLSSPTRIIHVETCLVAGCLEEARRELEDAIHIAETTLETSHRPDFYRLMGALHRLEGKPEADAWTQKAVDDARQLPSRSLELRALMDAAQHGAGAAERDEALLSLRECCAGFAAGQESSELKEAQALLGIL